MEHASISYINDNNTHTAVATCDVGYVMSEQCPAEWDYNMATNKCYKYLATRVNYTSAVSVCAGLGDGVVVAVPGEEEENLWLFGYVDNMYDLYKNIIIGLSVLISAV